MIHRGNEAVVRTDTNVIGHASMLFSFLKMDSAETCHILQIWLNDRPFISQDFQEYLKFWFGINNSEI